MNSASVISSLRWTKARSNDGVAPALLEFQSPSSAVISAPIPPFARGTVWVITSLVMVLIILAAVMPVDQVVTARGLVASQSPNILVQPLETAIVRSIDVREGQMVTKGQLLARLDPTFADADQAALAAQTSALEAEVARLTAEVDGNALEYLGRDSNWALQATLMGHRKAVYEAKLESFDRQLDELALVVSRARSDADGYRERLGVASSIEDMRKALEETQAGSQLDRLLAEDNRAEMARSLGNSLQTAEASERQQAAVSAERNAFIEGWRAETAQTLSEATARLSDAREELNKAEHRQDLVELRSNSEAIVQSVAKVSVGSVLQSGERLITLVPTGGTLEIEATIVGRSSGFVHVGDPVAVKFDTFPYSQYGMAYGTVRSVSPDSFSAQDQARDPNSSLAMLPSGQEPFYRAKVSLDRVALHDVPEGFTVAPGMPVTTDIKVGQRTVLKYLFGQALPLTQEGMREP